MPIIKNVLVLKPFLVKFAEETPERKDQHGNSGSTPSKTTPQPIPTMRTRVNGETTDDS